MLGSIPVDGNAFLGALQGHQPFQVLGGAGCQQVGGPCEGAPGVMGTPRPQHRLLHNGSPGGRRHAGGRLGAPCVPGAVGPFLRLPYALLYAEALQLLQAIMPAVMSTAPWVVQNRPIIHRLHI